MRVEQMTWPEYQDLIATRIVVLPIGAIDGHGPHLPLSTDTIIAAYLARTLESHLDVLVLPAVPYSQKTDPTASGGEFPGVTDLRASTLTNVVLDLLRASYRHGGGVRQCVASVRSSSVVYTVSRPCIDRRWARHPGTGIEVCSISDGVIPIRRY